MRHRIIAAVAVLFFAAPPAHAAGQVGRDQVERDQVMRGVAALQRAAQAAVDQGEVPGLSVAIVWKDEVVYMGGFGVRVAGRPEKVDADTVFQLASCSKPISSTVVAALVSDGVLSWDSRIADLDPAFHLADAYPTAQLTVADLFAHRSGLPGDAGNELEAIGYSRPDILKRLRLVKASSSFRAGYSYSNFGLTEGAEAAARVVGKPWEDIEEERLFKPLGMTSTSGRHSDFLRQTNRGENHVKINGAWTALVKRDPDPQSPAGGVSSNVRDLAKWMRLELSNGVFDGKRMIAESALARTHQPVTARGPDPVLKTPDFYALAWAVGYRSYGETWSHAGAFSTGARTLVTLVPGTGLGVVVLSGAFPTGVPEGLTQIFMDETLTGRSSADSIVVWNKLYASIFEPAIEAAHAQFGKLPANDTPALPNTTYVGRYSNPYVGEAAVDEKDGALTLRLGPGLVTALPLKHFNRDVFVTVAAPEMPDVLSPVTFQIGPDGKASQVTIDSVNGVGLGVLTRME
jgi:CubicO group peptidase (beta-lactamase class C family)